MITDKFGQKILDELDLCSIYMADRSRKVKRALVERQIEFSDELEIKNKPMFTVYRESNETIKEFDTRQQSNWLMPDEYKNLDIVVWLLDRCQTDEQLQRTGAELLLFQERNLFPLLQYLKYLVDTMRKHNMVWGVGRGSSVSSYVLFLIGVHKIDPLYFGLEIHEFLR